MNKPRSGAGAAHGAPEITVADYLRDVAGTGAQMVDVREPDEWVEGHIPGSVLMPMGEVVLRLRELDPKRPVITVCRSGRRSLYSAEELLAAGFRDVKSLAGGVIAWAEAGQPLER
ncbi:MAG: rhodanese-like domain-containing protein [Thermomicrobiales bacterium]|nr:rhodanese-like domain-containing protein [Thermomicrobiales bacterium]